jgi:hypothetical protein
MKDDVNTNLKNIRSAFIAKTTLGNYRLFVAGTDKQSLGKTTKTKYNVINKNLDRLTEQQPIPDHKVTRTIHMSTLLAS